MTLMAQTTLGSRSSQKPDLTHAKISKHLVKYRLFKPIEHLYEPSINTFEVSFFRLIKEMENSPLFNKATL